MRKKISIFNFQPCLPPERFSIQNGQALLVIVLVMVVILTVGLSVAARTIINLRSSTEEESSERAFSAAEAGIERALISTSTNPISDNSFGNNSGYTANITPISGPQFLLNNGSIISQDNGVDIWMVGHKSDGTPDWFNGSWSGTLTLYWGTAACPNVAAVEVIVLSGTSVGSLTSRQYAFDPCSARRTGGTGNNFSASASVSQIISPLTLLNSATITVTNGQMARVVPLYTNDYIGVNAPGLTVEQGRSVSSTGNVGNTQRKITAFKGWPSLPDEYFQYVIFQPNP